MPELHRRLNPPETHESNNVGSSPLTTPKFWAFTEHNADSSAARIYQCVDEQALNINQI